MDNIVSMFDIPLFEYDGYYDIMEDGTQYHVIEWKLSDMESYNNKYVVVCFDGYVRVYTAEGEKIFDDSLLNIGGFRKECMKMLKE